MVYVYDASGRGAERIQFQRDKRCGDNAKLRCHAICGYIYGTFGQPHLYFCEREFDKCVRTIFEWNTVSCIFKNNFRGISRAKCLSYERNSGCYYSRNQYRRNSAGSLVNLRRRLVDRAGCLIQKVSSACWIKMETVSKI